MASAFLPGNSGAILVYLLAGVALVLMAILPLDHSAGALPGPDLLMALTLVLVIRQPQAVPVLAIAAVFLLADLMWMRPPGIMTAAVVVGTEFLRRRPDLTTEVSFAAEWGVAAAIGAAIVIGQSAILSLLAVAGPSLGMLLIKFLGTVLAYPVFVAVLRLTFNVGRSGQPSQSGPGGGR
jgi:rod shape-determining protein MreD